MFLPVESCRIPTNRDSSVQEFLKKMNRQRFQSGKQISKTSALICFVYSVIPRTGTIDKEEPHYFEKDCEPPVLSEVNVVR